MVFLNALYERTCFYHCSSTLLLHCDSISALKQKENSPVMKKGEKKSTPSVPFSSLLSFFQSPHINSRHDKNIRVLCSHRKQNIFKNSWAWNVFTFYSIRDDNHCLREVFKEEPAFEATWLKQSVSRRDLPLTHLFTCIHTKTSKRLNWSIFKANH